MRLGIIASAAFNISNENDFSAAISEWQVYNGFAEISTLIHCGRIDITAMASDWSFANGFIDTENKPIEWKNFNGHYIITKDATGLINGFADINCNERIIDASEEVLLIWDGVSEDVERAINYCNLIKKSFYVYTYENKTA